MDVQTGERNIIIYTSILYLYLHVILNVWDSASYIYKICSICSMFKMHTIGPVGMCYYGFLKNVLLLLHVNRVFDKGNTNSRLPNKIVYSSIITI